MATLRTENKAKLPNLVRTDPIAASIISKLIKDDTAISSNQTLTNIPSISMFTYEKIQSNDDVAQLFPDVELCIQILTSCILSPNDMMTVKLNYQAPDIKLPTDLKTSLIDKIEKYIEANYKLNTQLVTILRESLFTKGSYIEAIVPEASLDEIISNYTNNNKNYNILGLENYLSSTILPTYNYLGKGYESSNINISYSIGQESLNASFSIDATGLNNNVLNTKQIKVTEEDMLISITDNPNILSVNQALLRNAKQYSKFKTKNNNLSIGQEDDSVIAVLDKFFRNTEQYQKQDYLYIPTKDDAKRKTIGAPLVLKLSAESVIPVHVINDPSKHLGYFVLLDNNGCPINAEYYKGMDMDTTYDMTNIDTNARFSLIKKAREALYGITKNDVKLENLESIYSQIVENMIRKKLETGAFSNLVDIKQSADIFRVMFSRALKAKQTKILFLPSDLVAFYAFDYRDNGTGKSLMEKTTLLYSLRAIMLFSRMLAYIKNSTNRTIVSTTLDENDPDQEGRMEQIMSEHLKLRQSQFPLGVTNLNDLVSWVQHLGLSFKFQGPGLPNTEINTEDTATSKIIPDEELDNKVKEYIFMAFGLTPEIVESGYSSEFATTVLAKNLLLAKRVSRIQDEFTEMVTEHIRKLIQNDMTLITELRNIVISNKKGITKSINKNKEGNEDISRVKKSELVDYIVNIFISELKIELPKPEMSEAQAMKQAFDYYKESVDNMSDVVFSSEAITDEYFGNMAGKIDAIKNMFKASLLLNWMNKNGYMPDLTDFLTKDDDGKPVFDALDNYKSFVDAIGESFLPFMKQVMKDKTKLDEKIQKVEEASNDSGSDDEYGNDENTNEGSEESTDENNDMDNEPTEDNNEDNTDESGGDEGGDMDMDMDMGDEGSGDSGGDDMDMDMGMDDMGMGDESSSSSSKNEKSPKEIELNEKLLEARLKKEQALAQKAAANAIEAKEKAGVDPTKELEVDEAGTQKEDEEEKNKIGSQDDPLAQKENEEEKEEEEQPTDEKSTTEDVLEPTKLSQYQSDIQVFNHW